MEIKGSARWPGFYIVGAPRSGTGFLWRALRSHPSVFMPALKEPLFMCADLDHHTDADRRQFIHDEADYLRLFSPAEPRQLTGEACIYNLLSTTAARRIGSVRPDARIIISLREPVAQMTSFHSIRVAEGQEELSLPEAIDAEADRLRGERLPPHAVVVPAYAYRRVASYSAQVERYLDAFPRDQVLLLVFEDLARDPQAWLDRVLVFLGLPAGSVAAPGVVNRRWTARSLRLSALTRSATLIGLAKRVTPSALHPRARSTLQRIAKLNRRQAEPPPIEAGLGERLRAELAPDVARVEKLLGRQLVEWRHSSE